MAPGSTYALGALSLEAPGLWKMMENHNKPRHVGPSHCNQHSQGLGCSGRVAAR